MMKRALTFLTLLLGLAQVAFSQQEPMYTKYMFNSLVFNPGYAGSRDFLSVGLLHRSQWMGIDGAPVTQTVTAHTPLRNDRVGVGFSASNDKIGPTNTTTANLVYAYRIPFGSKAKLSIGIQAGVGQFSGDYTSLAIDDPQDPSFQNDINKLQPNFGMGLYFYTDKFYAGFSSPYLFETDLSDPACQGCSAIYARKVRHYYGMIGTAIELNGDNLVFKPSFLWKNVGADKRLSKLEAFKDIAAPNEFDLDLSLLIHKRIWVGAAFRSAFSAKPFDGTPNSSYDSGDVWFSLLFPELGMRIGGAYDYPLTKIANVSAGSFELMLGWDFKYETSKAMHPRYF